jgi:exonuclease III
MLRGRWCEIIVMNFHTPTEDKIDDMKGSFYEELQRAFDKFTKYRMNILLGDFKVKVGREDILKSKIGRANLQKINNDNGVTVVTFAISKYLILKVQSSYIIKLIHFLGHLHMDRRTIKLTVF